MNAHATTPLDRMVRESRVALTPLAGTGIAINVLMLSAPLYSMQVFDRVQHSGSFETLVLLTSALVVSLGFVATLELARDRMTSRVGEWVEESLLPHAATLSTSGRFDLERNPVSDVKTIRAFVSSNGVKAILDLPWFPLFLLVCFLLHPYVGLYALITSAILFGIAVVGEIVTRRASEEAARRQAVVVQRLNEISRNRDAAAGLSMCGPMVSREIEANAGVLDRTRRVTDVAATMATISRTVRLGSQSLILAVGMALAMTNQASAGVVIASSILLGRTLAPIDGLISGWRSLQSARESWGRLRRAFGGWDASATTELPEPKGDLRIVNVSYRDATTGREILDGISLDAGAGQIVAVIGSSGSGKSTFCKVLVGALRPTGGEVRLDGASILDWTEAQRRDHVGYLPQDSVLFAGTVKENIARFTAGSDADVVAAATLAGCHEMILRLPGGYDCRLGENGAPLSGGQRQRVALARALFGRPRFLVLDEPNASLDTSGDAALAETLSELKGRGVTVFVVTHRYQLFSVADRVIALEDGRKIYDDTARRALDNLRAAAEAQVRRNASQSQDRKAA
ncbi:type I secretion system permease/ATPase [Methylobacterium brachiatum]